MALLPIHPINDCKVFEKTFNTQGNLVMIRLAYIMYDDTLVGSKYFEYFIKDAELSNLPPAGSQRRTAIRAILVREISKAHREWLRDYIPPPVQGVPSDEL